jgi:thiol-disulfide isomerase/thioredoxin
MGKKGPKKAMTTKIELCQKLPSVIAITAFWCGHCKNLKPHLAKLKEADGEHYHVKEIEGGTREVEQQMKDMQVTGFPTIVMYAPKVNQFFVYTGARNSKEMAHTLKTKMGELTPENWRQSGFEIWEGAAGAKIDTIVFLPADQC